MGLESNFTRGKERKKEKSFTSYSLKYFSRVKFFPNLNFVRSIESGGREKDF